MTFLFALNLCMGVPLFYFFALSRRRAQGAHVTVVEATLALLIGVAFCAGSVVGLFAPDSVKMDDTNWSPFIFLGAAAAGTLVYGYMAVSKMRLPVLSRADKGWQGAWILATLASAYVGYAALDHVIFWSDTKNVGIASSQLFDGTDAHCASDMILLRRDGDAFVYRCPHNISFGNPLGQPFVPWPSYAEGRSTQLVHAYNKMAADAQRSAAEAESAATTAQSQ